MVYTCKVQIPFRWAAAAKNKKDREIKEHSPKLFCRMKKTRRTMLSGSMQNHARPKDMCNKTRKTKRWIELVRPHHSCQFEI